MISTNSPHPTPDQVDEFYVLGRVLRSYGYWDACRLHRNRYIDRRFVGDLIENRHFFSPHTQRLIELFAAAQSVDRATLGFFPDVIFDKLCRAGVLGLDADGRVRSSYRVGMLDDLLILHEDYRDPESSVYFGEDSEFYANMLEIPRGADCLDLCAGTGVQALVCLSRGARHVDAVDINPRAAVLCAINMRLNGFDGALSFHTGDLFAPLPLGRRYDRITCNPPLLPIPPGVPYPVIGDGGIDGLKFVRGILSQLTTRLAEGGKCLMIGLSTAASVTAIEVLCARECRSPFSYVLYLLGTQSIDSYAKAVVATVQTFYPQENQVRVGRLLRQAFRDAGVETVVSYYLVVQRGDAGVASGVYRMSDCNRSRSYWFLGRY